MPAAAHLRPELAKIGLPARPWIIGHRGACGESPENTIESFRLAVEQRADMIELDLRLTSDGHLVAIHDLNLRRVTGHTVSVEDTSLNILRHLDVSYHFHRGRRRARIPTLEEVLDAIPPRFPLILDLKCRRAGRARYARALARVLAGRGHAIFASFHWRLLAEVKNAIPGAPVAPMARHRVPGMLRAAETLGASSIHCQFGAVTRRLLRTAAGAGRPVLAYTVDDSARARRLIAAGASGVFTNYPGKMRRDLTSRG
ncbi:MAG TPA: glycerophosphodiester phosphodiesterase [Thermoanaerobaculia bacterium]|nr:glycerophosphodiester phosphodiesterase [Thermoanaerobaculia bacterium]